MKAHENILVFYKAQPTYNPQMQPGKRYHRAQAQQPEWSVYNCKGYDDRQYNAERYPIDVITFSNNNV